MHGLVGLDDKSVDPWQHMIHAAAAGLEVGVKWVAGRGRSVLCLQ